MFGEGGSFDLICSKSAFLPAWCIFMFELFLGLLCYSSLSFGGLFLGLGFRTIGGLLQCVSYLAARQTWPKLWAIILAEVEILSPRFPTGWKTCWTWFNWLSVMLVGQVRGYILADVLKPYFFVLVNTWHAVVVHCHAAARTAVPPHPNSLFDQLYMTSCV